MLGNPRMIAMLGVLLAVVSTLGIAEDAKELKPPNDKERLQGTWTVVSLVVDGNLEKSDMGKTLTFNDDKLLLQALNGAELTLKLNLDKNPKQFDLFNMEGKRLVQGIYKLDDNTLTACYPNSLELRERPIEFSGAEGRKQVLLIATSQVVVANSEEAPDMDIVPQARPVFTWLEAVKNADQEKLKTVFSKEMRKEFDKDGWDKVLKMYQKVFKEDFGDYELEDFAFEYAGGEEKGKVSILYKSKKLPGLRVIKENGGWKVNEL